MSAFRHHGAEPLGRAWRGVFVVALAGFGALGLRVAASPSTAPLDLLVAGGMAAAFFVARMLTVRLPQGDEVCITLVVGLYALAVLDARYVVAASLVAAVADVLARSRQPRRETTGSRVLDSLRGAAVLASVAPFQSLLRHPASAGTAGGDAVIGVVLAAGLAYAALDVITVAALQRIEGGSSVRHGAVSLVRSLGTVYLVHAALAAVAVRLLGDSGTWAFPIALLLTLILQNSFNLYLRIRRAYAETIGALAHAAELDRPHDSGHARRVADLSIAVGRRIGLSSHELERLGYAALLHDIGRIGEAGKWTTDTHVQRGAEIVGSIPFLADVAPLIDGEQHPEHAIRETSAVIVRSCSRFDRLRLDLGSQAAIETLAARNGERSVTEVRVMDAIRELVVADHAEARFSA